MKLYLLQLTFYDKDGTETNSNVYSSLEKAKEEGIKNLENEFKYFLIPRDKKFEEMEMEELFRINNFDYDFTIVEIPDLEYAESFDMKEFDIEHEEDYKEEPTHIRYEFDYMGNLIERTLEYRHKNDIWRNETCITQYPEDLEEGAGEKFKIGDVVKVRNWEKYNYIEDHVVGSVAEKLFVVRWLPRKKANQKYFRNTYALISIYNSELFTFEYHEKDIEKYEGEVDRLSPIGILQRIIKEDKAIGREQWNDLKIGKVSFDTRKNYKEYLLEEWGEIDLVDDDWGFYSTTVTPKVTGLPVLIHPCQNLFPPNIKEYTPKMRVSNYDVNDTFFLTLEESPRVIIGECKLSKEDLEKVCDFIRQNLDILLKHFYSDEDVNSEKYFGDDELWDELKKRKINNK